MGKRGRPSMNGLQPGWMLERSILTLYAFHEARRNGAKYAVAISDAIEVVKARHPQMRIGPRRVKEILAALQPKCSPVALVVSKCSDAEFRNPETQSSPEGLHSLGSPAGKKVTVYRISVGARPEYPRTNSRQRGNAPECRR